MQIQTEIAMSSSLEQPGEGKGGSAGNAGGSRDIWMLWELLGPTALPCQ